jgi:hypothetical protein
MPVSAAERRALDQDGYLVLGGLLPGALLARLRRRADELCAHEGDKAGAEFR